MQSEKVKNKVDEYSAKSNLVVENATMSNEYKISDENHIDGLENAKSRSQTKKISNLNPDCLETIFEHLELNDLLSLADSSVQFYDAVCQVYRKKYLNKILILDYKISYR